MNTVRYSLFDLCYITLYKYDICMCIRYVNVFVHITNVSYAIAHLQLCLPGRLFRYDKKEGTKV